jgi:hypothetical protein
MARLTSALVTHKAPLDELCTLCETDKNTLWKKVCVVNLLRCEVEKMLTKWKYSGVLWKRVLEGGSAVSLTHMMDLRTMAWMPTCGNTKEGGRREGEGEDEDWCPNFQQDADNYKIEDIQPTLVHRTLLEHTICSDHTTFASTPMVGTVGHT